jgi:transposase
MRAHTILLSDRGYSPSEIAEEIADVYDVSHPTVYKWIDRFDEEGPKGLYDWERERRPRELGKEARKEIERLMEGNPTEEGQNATRWTAPRIAEHLERELGIDVHEDTVRGAPARVSPNRPGSLPRVASGHRRGGSRSRP